MAGYGWRRHSKEGTTSPWGCAAQIGRAVGRGTGRGRRQAAEGTQPPLRRRCRADHPRRGGHRPGVRPGERPAASAGADAAGVPGLLRHGLAPGDGRGPVAAARAVVARPARCPHCTQTTPPWGASSAAPASDRPACQALLWRGAVSVPTSVPLPTGTRRPRWLLQQQLGQVTPEIDLTWAAPSEAFPEPASSAFSGLKQPHLPTPLAALSSNQNRTNGGIT